MLFTHQDKNNASIQVKPGILSNNNRTNNNNIGVFSLNRNKPIQNINRITNIRAINGLLPTTTEPIPHRKEMTWGRATWFLFHTLAEKVKEEYFLQIKKELCNNIYKICSCLPCELCRAHAIEYVQNINFDNIQTKTDFKRMLFNFHNVVNKNKNYQIYKYEDLDEQYKKGNLIQIINNFFTQHSISRNKNSPTLVMFHTSIMDQFKLWLKDNLQYFNK
tara:strand:+ start:32 stop:688 length:657 start_codon:yes stop_codon:yes gene_type:complete